MSISSRTQDCHIACMLFHPRPALSHQNWSVDRRHSFFEELYGNVSHHSFSYEFTSSSACELEALTLALCMHTWIGMALCAEARKINAETFLQIASSEGIIGPELGPEDICEQCLQDANEEENIHESQRADIEKMVMNLNERPKEGLFVSRSWLQ